MGEGDPRSSAHGRADLRHAIPLWCQNHKNPKSRKKKKKSFPPPYRRRLLCDRELPSPFPGAGGNSWRSRDDKQTSADHRLLTPSVTSRIGSLLVSAIAPGSRTHVCELFSLTSAISPALTVAKHCGIRHSSRFSLIALCPIHCGMCDSGRLSTPALYSTTGSR